MMSLENITRRDFIRTASLAFGAIAFSSLDMFAAGKERESILLTDIYDNKYNTINDELALARKFYSMSLQDLVDKRIITPELGDLSLPLGVGDGSRKVNLLKGMKDMWNNKRGIKKSVILQKKRDYFVGKMRNGSAKSSLRKYRKEEIQQAVNLVSAIHANYRGKLGKEEMKFMDTFVETFSPNILLAYNIHELTPTKYLKKRVNPVAKSYFFDKYLQVGGKEFIEGYPARYDALLSYGPFQLTHYAMDTIKTMNKYSPIKAPTSMGAYTSLSQHVNAAAMFAYGNFVNLARSVDNGKVLGKLNNGLDRMKTREKRIFFSGITACLHHMPSATQSHMKNFLKKNGCSNIQYTFKDSMGAQLKKYYDSSAEIYMFLKVFHAVQDSNSQA